MIIYNKQNKYYSPVLEKKNSKFSIGFGTKESLMPSQMFAEKTVVAFDQIHSNKIREIRNLDQIKNKKEIKGDGIISSLKNVVLTIKTADCLPIVCADLETGKIGIAHAGWRGTYLNIAGQLIRKFDPSKSLMGRIKIYLGPCIGICCYEIDRSLYDKFSKKYPKEISDCSRKELSSYFLNISRLNYFQLIEAGISPHQIKSSPLCTKCRSDRFYSVRREGPIKKRMISYITKT